MGVPGGASFISAYGFCNRLGPGRPIRSSKRSSRGDQCSLRIRRAYPARLRGPCRVFSDSGLWLPAFGGLSLSRRPWQRCRCCWDRASGAAYVAGFGGSLSLGGSTRPRGADLRGSASLAAAPSVMRDGVALVVASASLTGDCTRTRLVAASLTAEGAVIAEVAMVRGRVAQIEAQGVAFTAARRTAYRAGNGAASGNLAVSINRIRPVNCVATGATSAFAFGSRIGAAGAGLAAAGRLFSFPSPSRMRSGFLSVSTALRASSLIERGGATGITGAANMRVVARKQMRAYASNALNLGI